MGPVKCEPFSNLPAGENWRVGEYKKSKSTIRASWGFNELFTLQIGSLICIKENFFLQKRERTDGDERFGPSLWQIGVEVADFVTAWLQL